MKRSTDSSQPFRTRSGRPRRRWLGEATAGAVDGSDQSLSDTVEKTSAVSGLGSRPCTFSATTRAGGECEIGTPGR